MSDNNVIGVAQNQAVLKTQTVESADFLHQVAQGLKEGHTAVSIFGENPLVATATTEDIWDGGGVYTFSATADIDRLSSSSASDTQEILIKGLVEGYIPAEQTVTLNGKTPVAIPTPFLRVHSMCNEGSADIDGTVYFYVDSAVTDGVPDDAAKIRAQIVDGNNQSLMMVYTVPAGKTLYYTQGFVTVGRATDAAATFTLRTRKPGGIFKVKRRISLNSGASSLWLANYMLPRKVPEKTDIIFTCQDTTKDTPANGGFEGYLKDNDI